MAAAIIFHLFWEKQINNILVNNVLMLVQSSATNDFIFIGVILLATGVLVSRVVRRYVPSDRQSFVALVLLCFYVYYRLDGTVWKFQHFTFAENIKYADALAGVLWLQVLLWILSYNYQSFLGVKIILLFKNIKTFLNKSLHVIYVYYRFIRRKINKKIRRNHIPTLPNQFPNVAPILDDLPLEDGGDTLGYGTYAQQIAQKIHVTTASKRAIAIGVHGQWGSGKTSFMNLLRTELKKENYILLDFAAWNSQTPQAIVQDFFQTLQAEMSQYHDQTASLLTNYANQLVKLKDNPTTQIIQSVSAAFTGFESTQQLHERINDSIARIGRKIMIFIDDLDRLDKAEIVEVLRLIRNTANFQNTFFVVAYDRDYIVNALEKSDFHGAAQYLEKIFQLEINLPAYERDVLVNVFFEKLKHSFSYNEYYIENDLLILSKNINIRSKLKQYLNSLRDVTRVVNSISLNIANIYNDVNLKEFIFIEFLRMKDIVLYKSIFWNISEHLKEDNDSNGRPYYSIKLQENNRYDIVAYAIFKELFSKNETHIIFNYNPNSIIYPSKFHRYFGYRVLKGESIFEVNKMRDFSVDIYLQNIEDLLNKYGRIAHNTLCEYFEIIDNIQNIDDLEKIIRAVLLIARKNNDGFSKIWEYDNINNILYKYAKSNNIDKLKDLFLEIFSNTEYDGIVESGYIRHIFKYKYFLLIEKDIFSKEELLNIIVKHLQRYLESVAEHKRHDDTIVSLFYSCFYYNETNTKVIYEPAKKILQDYIINKNLDNFILDSIEKNRKHAGTIFYNYGNCGYDGVIHEEEFLSRIFAQKDKGWKYIEEFEKFYNAIKANNFEPIAFRFDTIPTNQILKNHATYLDTE
ncbi:KAP family P-loop NTPase fold protein [Flexibacter flexilis]|uniref:KAP family P-loop NTPase fold protein n=1 Tax=Flexibacter flexilis TaxID=998 RepID=UPI0015A653FB|nr:P-loop NTPase fold protein [Flexibacter flexilis]